MVMLSLDKHRNPEAQLLDPNICMSHLKHECYKSSAIKKNKPITHAFTVSPCCSCVCIKLIIHFLFAYLCYQLCWYSRHFVCVCVTAVLSKVWLKFLVQFVRAIHWASDFMNKRQSACVSAHESICPIVLPASCCPYCLSLTVVHNTLQGSLCDSEIN